MILETIDEIMEKREKRGEKRGLKRGEMYGKKVGIEIGIKEAKLEDAREMLKEGLDVEFIQKITKLSKEEILELKKG
jgi:predicted transposase/invertase (TIGR01784 family)